MPAFPLRYLTDCSRSRLIGMGFIEGFRQIFGFVI